MTRVSCSIVISSPGGGGCCSLVCHFVDCLLYYFVNIAVLVSVVDEDLCEAFRLFMCGVPG